MKNTNQNLIDRETGAVIRSLKEFKNKYCGSYTGASGKECCSARRAYKELRNLQCTEDVQGAVAKLSKWSDSATEPDCEATNGIEYRWFDLVMVHGPVPAIAEFLKLREKWIIGMWGINANMLRLSDDVRCDSPSGWTDAVYLEAMVWRLSQSRRGICTTDRTLEAVLNSHMGLYEKCLAAYERAEILPPLSPQISPNKTEADIRL